MTDLLRETERDLLDRLSRVDEVLTLWRQKALESTVALERIATVLNGEHERR